MPITPRRPDERLRELEAELRLPQPSPLTRRQKRVGLPPLSVAQIVEKGLRVALEPNESAKVAGPQRREVLEVVQALQKAATPPNGRPLPRETRIRADIVARRAAASLAPSSSITPPEIEAALHAQGIDWVEPFAPGRPLVPYYGYSRRPRLQDYEVGRNITTETRPGRIPFETLLRLWESYDVARTCTRHSINDLRSIRVRFEAMDGYEENPVKEIAAAKAFLKRPDGKQTLRNFVAQNQLDLWRFDQAPIYRLRDRAGRLKALQNVQATTIAPILDYYGAFPEGDAPAFQQFIMGVPWNWLKWDDLIFQPFWPETESPYGTPPLETVLINANTDIRLQMYFLQFFCYDDQTEVLTRDGWRKFADLSGSEEFATRSAEGRFEWQHTVDGEVHRFDYDGELVKFSNQCVDQLVTPNHRMLVRRLPGHPRVRHNESHDWHIRRADFFVENPTAEFQVPVTSQWQGERPAGEIVLTAEAAGPRGRVREVRMPTWAWAQFLGIFVAEGYCRRDRHDVIVSQFPNGDLDEVQRILKDTGLTWLRSEKHGTFTCSSKALWTALQDVGHGAPNKRLPSSVMDWPVDLLQDLLHGLMVGDGHIGPTGQRVYTTTSEVLAGQVQELWQKTGVYAGVHRYEPDPRTFAKLVQYKVRTRPEEAFRVPRPLLVHYEGVVSCVSVPNGIIMVRRNGKAIWCGNTTGTVPEAFATAPEGESDPDALADWQEMYNAWTVGDQSQRWGLRWLPFGTKITPYKPQQFDPDIAEYVERRTISAFGLTPQDLGILADVNKATSDTQMDTQFRISTLPIVGYYEDLFDAVLQDDLDLPVQLRFDTGREKEDRLMEAQSFSLAVEHGVVSPDEWREKVYGYPTDPTEKVPRAIYDQRLGIIPISYVHAISGDIDPLTGAPRPGTVQPEQFMLPTMQAPPPPAEDQPMEPDAPAGGGARPKGDPTKVYPEVHNPVHPQAPHNPLTVGKQAEPDEDSDEDSDRVGRPEDTGEAGGYAEWGHGSTGQGTGVKAELAKWRTQSRRRVAQGKAPRPFEGLAPAVHNAVWEQLSKATTREGVDAAFAKATPKAAGIVVQAKDTGRVLLVRRSPDKHDPHEAYARWEFPGGKLDQEGDTPWSGALREWSEETGAEMAAFEHLGNWTSPDGDYVGFVVEVPSEAEIRLRPDQDEVASAGWWDKDALGDPQVRDKVTETLDRVTPLLKGWDRRNQSGRYTTRDLRWSDFHRNTDKILGRFAPRIGQAMAEVLRPEVIRQAVAAGSAERAMAMLERSPRSTESLASALGDLYAAAYAEGAKEAAWACNGVMPSWMAAAGALEKSLASTIRQLAAGGLARILRQMGLWLKEITDTEVRRIGDAIAEGVEHGFPVAEVTAQIDQIVHDKARAYLIAETEYARARTVAMQETYVQNNVPEVQWLEQPDACALCQENHAVSPQPTLAQRWPNGPTPVHPGERCVIAPLVRVPQIPGVNA